ncbi:MAG: response regulator transcription factor [Elusimicrobiales bacterium]|nr:response regulator transcription factor [Elusimicrobiales bacterium]
MPIKLLLIDDDKDMLKVMRKYLEIRNFNILFTDNASEGLMMARESIPDIIITDAEMPDINGFSLCKIIKNEETLTHVPVIIISGEKIDDEDIIEGYEKGADDYLIKPFSFNILLLKIQAVLRRHSAFKETPHILKNLGMEINPSQRTLKINNQTVNLTRKEFDLLALFISKENHILSIPYLLETVWGYDPANYNDPHTVEVHISRLKKKLGSSISSHINTITGHGYKFSSDD